MSMMMNTSGGLNTPSGSQVKKKSTSLAELNRQQKQKAYEKAAGKAKIKTEDLMLFTKQFSSMLKAGLPLLEALQALEDQVNNPIFRIIIKRMRNDIANGTTLSAAAKKFPNAFPNLFTSLAEAGEASGNLPEIMEKVAGYFEATVKLLKKVKSAMVYPVIVICLAIGLVIAMMVFVIPTFAEMFSTFGSALPKPTQMLIDTSHAIKDNIVFIIVGGGLLFYVLKRYFSTPKGRITRDKIFRKLMIVGPLTQKVNVSRFCRTFSILMKSGVSVLKCIQICSAASDNYFIETASKKMTNVVTEGGKISSVIENEKYFPKLVGHMVRAGEKTGNVDVMLNNVSDFYDDEIDNTVAGLSSAIEPLLIIFIGVVVGGIVICMFLPIFNLAGTIK